MDELIWPDADSHWSLKFKTIMKTFPNTTSGMIKYKLIRFFFPPYLVERAEFEYIVPSPELNLWYVLIGFLIVMPIIFYVVYKEIAAIIFCSKSVILTPDDVDLVNAIKMTKQTNRSAEREINDTHNLNILDAEIQRNRLGLPNGEGIPNLSQGQKQLYKEVIGDSRNLRDHNHGHKV
ncbi:uncharacterized protein Dwil_GK13087 [Drosophila willistoni]|uniref:Uncharacterized protein n=1 Tax=Drosophila willistoni TaxID=7260 RepID=B4NH34_DROWI|nr:uncharacterized protein Dwil_GK13087 [Drosophila willistoni]